MAPQFKRRVRQYQPRRRLSFPRKPPLAKTPLADGGLTRTELEGWWPTGGLLNSPPVEQSGRGLNSTAT
jgi:hypothetical protein